MGTATGLLAYGISPSRAAKVPVAGVGAHLPYLVSPSMSQANDLQVQHAAAQPVRHAASQGCGMGPCILLCVFTICISAKELATPTPCSH